MSTFKWSRRPTTHAGGQTRRAQTITAFLDAADTIFAAMPYDEITKVDIAEHAGRSRTVLNKVYPYGKSQWLAAVLDRKLSVALAEQSRNPNSPVSTRRQLRGDLLLFAGTAALLPGVGVAVITERMEGRAYDTSLPAYYDEVVRCVEVIQGPYTNHNKPDEGFVADKLITSLATMCIDASAQPVDMPLEVNWLVRSVLTYPNLPPKIGHQ